MYEIVFLTGELTGVHKRVRRAHTTIGASPLCEICVPDPAVAKQHAVLTEKDNEVLLRVAEPDLRVKVNGKSVGEMALRHMDVIEVGETRLQFEVAQRESVSRRYLSWIGWLAVLAAAAVVFVEAGGWPFVVEWVDRVRHQGVGRRMVEEAPAEATEGERAGEGGGRPASPVPSAEETKPAPAAPVAEERKPTPPAPVEEPPKPSAPVPVVEERKTPAPAPVVPAPAAASASGPPSAAAIQPAAAPKPSVSAVQPAAPPAAVQPKPAASPPPASRSAVAVPPSQPVRLPAPAAPPKKVEAPAPVRSAPVEAKTATPEPAPTPKPSTPPVVAGRRVERPATLVEAPADPKRAVRIASLEHHRFPNNPEVSEMRLLSIKLERVSTTQEIRADRISMRVLFYDEVMETHQIIPTRLNAAGIPKIQRDKPGPDGTLLVTANYTIPKGDRERESRVTGQRTQYYGYAVKVYYDGVLQDEDARPKTLLTASPP